MRNTRTELNRVFLIGGLSVIGGFAGTGVASVVAGLAANRMSRTQGDELMAGSGLLLLAGGVLGLICGFMLALFLFKQRPAAAQAEVERKYIGGRGIMVMYAGLPMFLTGLLLLSSYEALAHRVGEGAAPYMFLLAFMLIAGLALYCFERIPRSLIMPIGLLGWLLTFAFACWYGWFGPAALGHH